MKRTSCLRTAGVVLRGIQAQFHRPAQPYRYFALEPHKPSPWLVLAVALLVGAAAAQFFFMQAIPAVAEGIPSRPFNVYENKYTRYGNFQIVSQDFWWEDEHNPKMNRYQPVLTAELHLITDGHDERMRVRAGQALKIGEYTFTVLAVDGSTATGSYVTMQFALSQ